MIAKPKNTPRRWPFWPPTRWNRLEIIRIIVTVNICWNLTDSGRYLANTMPSIKKRAITASGLLFTSFIFTSKGGFVYGKDWTVYISIYKLKFLLFFKSFNENSPDSTRVSSPLELT